MLFRVRLTYANVVSTLCLFILLGGSAVAAGGLLNGNKIKNRSIAGKKLKLDTVTGREIKESTLRQVPSAGDASTLGGSPSSAFERRVRWAYVAADGTIGAQSGGFSLSNHYTGGYYLDVGADASNQAITVTLHGDQGGSGYGGEVSASLCGNASAGSGSIGQVDCVAAGTNDTHHVFVAPGDSSGAAKDHGFYIEIVG